MIRRRSRNVHNIRTPVLSNVSQAMKSDILNDFVQTLQVDIPSTPPLKITNNSPIRLSLKVSKKYIFLSGKDLYTLKNHIPKNKRKLSNDRPNYSNGIYKYNRGKYNKYNKIKLDEMMSCRDYINNKYSKYKIIYNTMGTLSNKYGIIGYDVPYNNHKMVSDITGDDWELQYGPVIYNNNIIQFGDTFSTNPSKITRIVQFLQRKKFKKYNFNNIFPNAIHFNLINAETTLIDFLKSKYTVSYCGWDNHARCIYKKDNTLILIDPWKQNIGISSIRTGFKIEELFKKICEEYGFKFKFQPRAKEQGTEGSCGYLVLMRMMMISILGPIGATLNIVGYPEFPLIVSRLFTLY